MSVWCSHPTQEPLSLPRSAGTWATGNPQLAGQKAAARSLASLIVETVPLRPPAGLQFWEPGCGCFLSSLCHPGPKGGSGQGGEEARAVRVRCVCVRARV